MSNEYTILLVALALCLVLRRRRVKPDRSQDLPPNSGDAWLLPIEELPWWLDERIRWEIARNPTDNQA